MKRPRSWWVGALVLGTLAVVGSVVVGGDKRHVLPLDVFDEGGHYAYVVALQDGSIPVWGETLDQRTMRLADCLGYQVGNKGADCSRRAREPGDFPAGGYSYEAQQPPFGYIPFAITARPDAEPKAAIAAARHGGAIWTAAGALLLVVLAAVEGLSLLALTAMLATCLLSPVHIYAAATVNNDAAGVAAGALALLTASFVRRRERWSVTIGVAVGATIGVGLVMTKGIFIVAPFALVVAALLKERRWSRAGADRRAMIQRNACPIAMLAGGAVAFVGWIVIQNIRARVPSATVLEALLGFTRTEHLQVTSMLTGLRGMTSLLIPYFGDSPTHYLWNLTFFAVVIGVVALKGRSAETDAWCLAFASLVGVLFVSVGWTVLSFLQGHYDGIATARYGLPLLPLMALVVVRSAPPAGLVVLGVAFPAAAVIWQMSAVRL